MAARKVVVEITGDSKPYAKATDDAVRTTEGFADRMKKVGMDLKGGFLQGIGIGGGISVFDTVSKAVGSVVTQVGKAIDLASDKAEAASKANVLFGESYSVIEDGSRRAATAVGMSSGAYIAAAGDVGNLLKNMGIAGQEAAGMSKNMLQLAADVGSFNNADPTEVVEAMGAAFRGESDPIQRFGVFLSAAKVEAKALSMGLKNGKGPLTDYAKAMATYQIILEQTASAQGDFARTADGKANADRINAAKAEEAWTRMGEALMPLYQKAMPLLAEATTGVVDILTNLATVVGPLVDGAIGAIATAIDTVSGAFKGLWEMTHPAETELEKIIALARRNAEATGLDADAVERYIRVTYERKKADEARFKTAFDLAAIDGQITDATIKANDAIAKLTEQLDEATRAGNDRYLIDTLALEIENKKADLAREIAPLEEQRAALLGRSATATGEVSEATAEQNRMTAAATRFTEDYNKRLEMVSKTQAAMPIIYGQATRAVTEQAGAYTDAAYRMRGSGGFGSVLLATAEATKTHSKEITTAMLRLAHSGETVPGTIRRDLSPLAGIVRGSLKRAKREAEEGMADLNWALEHPMQGEKLERLYRRKLREAYQKLHQAQQTGNTVAVAKAQALIDDLTSKMNELKSVRISIQTTLDNRAEHGANSRGFEYRAEGGPVKRNKAYIVGEKRAEVFVPDQDGTIIPSIAQAAGGGGGWTGGGGGGATVINNFTINVPPTTNLAEVGREITRALKAFGQGGGQASMRAAIGVR